MFYIIRYVSLRTSGYNKNNSLFSCRIGVPIQLKKKKITFMQLILFLIFVIVVAWLCGKIAFKLK